MKLLMGQAKRHAPRSSTTASTCLDIIIKILNDFSLAECSEDILRHFIHTIIELADIAIYFPAKTALVCLLLERTTVAAQNFGDTRSVAILHLIHAHLLTFGSFDISPQADKLFDIGFEMGESIGDEDMIEYISTFLGFRHFLKGEFKEAEMQFSKVRGRFALPNSQYWWVVFHGMSSAFLGFDRQAIGSLESALQSAILRNEQLSAEFLRLHLALVLLMFGKTREALAHINAVSEQVDSDSVPVLQIRTAWILMFYHYCTGNLASSHAMMEKINDILVQSNIAKPMHHFPWILETLYIFKKKGMKEAKHFNLKKEFELSSQSPSNQIKAGAWRIRGIMALEEPVTDLDGAMNCLKKALKMYINVGNPIETARVKLDLARVYTHLGRNQVATRLRAAAYRIHRHFGQPAWLDEMPRPRTLPTEDKEAPWLRNHGRSTRITAPVRADEFQRQRLAMLCRKLRVEQAAFFSIKDGEINALSRYNISKTFLNEQIIAQYKSWIMRHLQTKKIERRRGKHGSCILISIENISSNTYLFLLNKYFEDDLLNLSEEKIITSTKSFFKDLHFIQPDEQEAIHKPGSTANVVISPNATQDEFITNNETMLQLLLKLKQATATDVSIHIFGETGVGKELLARFIHRHSGRRGSFVCVHPASMTESLFESAFFGHEKGSFTGATNQKIGFFELANEGTLFIDEVGELPLSTQAKFLRVLQERTFIRVGGLREIRSNFRLVTATNRDLEQEIAAGRFRMDLYYRISVVPVEVPALRMRGDDSLILAQVFLDDLARKYQRGPVALSEANRRLIAAYPWPGNVRELENVIERAVILYNGGNLDLSLQWPEGPTPKAPEAEPSPTSDIVADWPTLEEIERRYIKMVLDRTDGQIDGNDGAAALLGIGRSTLYAKIRRFGFKQSRRFE
ncbi:sigma-54 interaction domain-containing protein [Desulfomicrobium apsheronum]|uniref:sigma-54 interaction domain-containing protein n=1 Tax=Desulfomicrobium apsheronum TaxID=52560 RepID=UPI0015A663A8|nr:sigma-54 dependent transcriptional regulator [Desulfomicrobium apsheronum]